MFQAEAISLEEERHMENLSEKDETFRGQLAESESRHKSQLNGE